jgi:hypothetical protein
VALKQWKQCLVSLIQHNKKKQIEKNVTKKSCSFNLAVHLRQVCYLKDQTPCISLSEKLAICNCYKEFAALHF